VSRILAKEQYTKRHDGVCPLLHYHIYKEIAAKLDKKHWYNHVTKSVETGQEGKVIILLNQQVRTDITIPNNKADIPIRHNKQTTRTLIDAAIPEDRNVIKREAQNILKYKDITEIQRIRNGKAKVIQVTINTTGTISK